MQDDVLIRDLKDSLIKLEGLVNILKETPEVIAYRRAQGARDKISSLVIRIINERRSGDDSCKLVEGLQRSLINESD